jgi:hypothetical protein
MSVEAAHGIVVNITMTIITLLVVNLNSLKDLASLCLIAITAGYTAWKWHTDYKREKRR